MIRPALDQAVAFNRSERREDEWFQEPDDLDRVQRAVDSIADIDDLVEAAAVLAYLVALPRASGKGTSARRCCWLAGCLTGTARTGSAFWGSFADVESREPLPCRHALTAAITREGPSWVARCLEVEVTSQGESLDEARANLTEAVELYFEDEQELRAPESPIIAPIDIRIAG